MRRLAMIPGLLAALLAVCAAQAKPVTPQQSRATAAAPGLSPFAHDAVDDKVLAWAKRWAEANLDDPADRFALLSYAVSAAQRRQVMADMNGGEELSDQSSDNILTEFTHLRHVGFLAELRTVATPAGQAAKETEWSARHLCNGTLIAPRWILTTVACASQPAAVPGIEVRLGVRDLSQPEGITRRVTQIERNDEAGLALLGLDAEALSDGATSIEPPGALTPAAVSIDFEEFLGLGYGRASLPGWPKVLYRHFSLFDQCETGNAACLVGEGQRFCAGDDGSPIYVYDLQQGPLLAGVLALPRGANHRCLEISEMAARTASDREPAVASSAIPASVAPVVAVAQWSQWIDRITGARSTITKPRKITAFVSHQP